MLLSCYQEHETIHKTLAADKETWGLSKHQTDPKHIISLCNKNITWNRVVV